MRSAKPRHKSFFKDDAKNDDDSRIIMMSCDVDQKEVGDIIQDILEINEDDDKAEAKNSKYVRRPIKLIINSGGGSIYDGLGLIDAMDGSKTPVYTYCYGQAMSMGMVIFVCGHYRYMGKYATIMYHEGGYGLDYEKVQGHKQQLKEVERIEELCDGIILARTKLKRKDLNAIKNKKVDWYMTAEEALKYQVTDEIL